MRDRKTAVSRAEAATLMTLERDLGKETVGHLDRQKLIDHGKMRAAAPLAQDTDASPMQAVRAGL
jgi:hypothetical protein